MLAIWPRTYKIRAGDLAIRARKLEQLHIALAISSVRIKYVLAISPVRMKYVLAISPESIKYVLAIWRSLDAIRSGDFALIGCTDVLAFRLEYAQIGRASFPPKLRRSLVADGAWIGTLAG